MALKEKKSFGDQILKNPVLVTAQASHLLKVLNNSKHKSMVTFSFLIHFLPCLTRW